MMDELRAALKGKQGSGVYVLNTEAAVDDISRLVEQHGFRFFYIDGEKVSSAQDFFDLAKTVMEFPYFGDNWNALLDCMRDLSWCPAQGYVLLYDDFQNFAQNDHRNFYIAVDVMQDAADFWNTRKKDTPMYILLRGDETLVPGLQVFGPT